MALFRRRSRWRKLLLLACLAWFLAALWASWERVQRGAMRRLHEVALEKLAPARRPAGLRFAVAGDTDSGGPWLRAMLADIATRKVDLLVICGDLCYEGDASEFADLAELLASQPYPVFVTAGNHDRYSDPDLSEYARFLAPIDADFQLGGYSFVFLDTSRETVSAGSFAHLDAALKRSAARRTFVFTHVPPADPRHERNRRGQMKNHALSDPEVADHLVKKLERAGVVRLFAGHIHEFLQGRVGALPFTVTGGGSDPDAGHPHQYVLVEDDGAELHQEMVLIPASTSWCYSCQYLAHHLRRWWLRYWDSWIAIALAPVLLLTLLSGLPRRLVRRTRRAAGSGSV